MSGAGAPAVVVHTAAEVRAAGAAAGVRGVLLLSAPGAAESLGAAWFLAMVRAGAGDPMGVCAPALPRAVLDCGAAPGLALGALHLGVRGLVLDPACPGFDPVVGAAAAVGGAVWRARPAALNLGALDLRRAVARERLAAWLA